MKQLHHFLRELDDAWKPLTNTRWALPLIGSGALMLLTDYERGTKDGDVFQTADISDTVKSRLLTLGGKGTPLHTRHRLYIDVVDNGLPFLPQTPVWLCEEVAAEQGARRRIESVDLAEATAV
ncbi:MAG: hypothetical protein H6725_06235 [Sandaracinaceae bacterium]|nr:hypothetical protein [Sandaracinaceae bacterium]